MTSLRKSKNVWEHRSRKTENYWIYVWYLRFCGGFVNSVGIVVVTSCSIKHRKKKQNLLFIACRISKYGIFRHCKNKEQNSSMSIERTNDKKKLFLQFSQKKSKKIFPKGCNLFTTHESNKSHKDISDQLNSSTFIIQYTDLPFICLLLAAKWK